VVFMVLMVHLCDKTTLLENRHVAEDQKHREKRIVVVVVVKTVPALDELYPHDIGWRE
jgi:Flp pilus assembly protein CpaB